LGPPIAHCQGCGSELGHSDISRTFLPAQSRPMVTCNHCGSQEIVWPKEQEEAEVLF
jgi:DNA-directed RNA polymerase subunit RPC12/RpoP